MKVARSIKNTYECSVMFTTEKNEGMKVLSWRLTHASLCLTSTLTALVAGGILICIPSCLVKQ